MLEKKRVIELPFCYTVNTFKLGDKDYIAAGSEQNYPAYLISLEDNIVTKISDGPGGMMSMLPIPGKTDQLVSVMGLFPPFIGAEAGIYFHSKTNGEWSARKVISLPFLHRCEILTINGKNHLFAATVSIHKDNPTDWSKPGEVYYINIEGKDPDEWKPELIYGNLFRNHGMIKYKSGNSEMICISGDKGIFSIQPGKNDNWQNEQIFDQEVSEFCFYDLDNDGIYELVTIEPFHGTLLKVYKQYEGKWQTIYTSPLSFGHGLSVGNFQGQNIIVVGNRRESCNLEMHKVMAADKIEISVVENDVGPTQTKVFNHNGVDYILSSNQKKNEVVLYY